MEKSITLSGAETKIEYGGGANAWLRNDGASTVYAARTAGIVAGADGVISIPAGGSAPVYGADGAVYLLGTGSVQLIGSDYSTNPFNGVSRGGAADIPTGAAGMVTLDELQGGVPFSEMVLDGDVIGQKVTLRACGKNLIPYPYRSKSGTVNGVTFTVSDDGSITANGTATANTNFYICFDRQLNFPNGKYTMSGCPAGGGLYTYRMEAYSYDDDNKIIFSEKDIGSGAVVDLSSNLHFGIRIGIFQGVTCESLVFRPQLECGAAATAYEPYRGSEVKITPDAVPYTVPNDIRQQDGVNNVMVSAGTVQVTGVRRDAALKKVWDKLDELTTAIIVSNGD